jgi:chromosome segregation ATPase
LSRSQGELKDKFAAQRAALEEQLNRAETALQGNLNALKEEIAGRTKKLHIEIANQQSELDKAVRRTNATLKEARSEVMKLQWKKGTADREWARYAGVSFRAYLKKVGIGR